MFSGAQLSLYPMTDAFVPVILSSISALEAHKPHIRIDSTDGLSTFIVGPPERLFPAMRDLLVSASSSGMHVVLHALVSRGCPGSASDEFCSPKRPPRGSSDDQPGTSTTESALQAVRSADRVGQVVAAQFAYYPLGGDHHMKEIYACIDFIKASGVFDKEKNFCTTLRGDAGAVFETLSQAFVGFADEGKHVTLDLTVSANSPTKG